MLQGLGLAENGKQVFLFRRLKESANGFTASISADGFDFELSPKIPSLVGKTGKEESISKCSDFKVTRDGDDFMLLYKYLRGEKNFLHIAKSKDLFSWEDFGSVPTIHETSAMVTHASKSMPYVMYFGESNIKLAISDDLADWKINKNPVLEPRAGKFDQSPLSAETAGITDDGIVLIYAVHGKNNDSATAIGAALFDKDDPSKLLWRSESPIWQISEEWKNKVHLLGIIDFNGSVFLYWEDDNGDIYAVNCMAPYSGKDSSAHPKLARFEGNPIIEPRKGSGWESRATFNAAAFTEGDKVHLLYRAVGSDDISRIGYATSSDGTEIDERFGVPVYVPREAFEGVNMKHAGDPIMYASGGGGLGGCEDPRIVRIDGMLYMTFVAFNGWNSVRMAMTSISVDDFLARRWNWKKPVLISPPGQMHKNWMIFPEKINGKFAILHSVTPRIAIDYFDDLNELDGTKYISSDYQRPPQSDGWDSWVRGAGPPPIKTGKGWLLLYHAMDHRDPNRYKLGAMLLDLDDPTKVLYRCKKPILEPDERYENEGWKAGVIYSCGAVVKNGNLVVYYGGADMVICVATAKLDKFLEDLINTQEPKLEKISIAEAKKVKAFT
jgi:beta-1,2-mannobiose phosphorylase / 1,2-beta-oligomannan phosphorylase